jgi:large subunit ribosomal protein L22
MATVKTDTAKKPAASKAPAAKPTAPKTAAKPAAKPAATKAAAPKAVATKAPAKPAAAKPAAKPAAKTPLVKPAAQKKEAQRQAAKSAPAKKTAAPKKVNSASTRIADKKVKTYTAKETRPHAIAKHIRMSSTKVRIVMDLVRGKSYNDAAAILKSLPNAAAEVVLKCMNSAAANGENNLGINKDDMYVAEIFTTQGPTLKRINIRARGRVDRMLKRTCHVYVILDARDY